MDYGDAAAITTDDIGAEDCELRALCAVSREAGNGPRASSAAVSRNWSLLASSGPLRRPKLIGVILGEDPSSGTVGFAGCLCQASR